MRAFAVSIDCSTYPCVLPQPATTNTPTKFSLFPCKFTNLTSQISSTKYLLSQFRPYPYCSSADSTLLDDDSDDNEFDNDDYDDDDYYSFTGEVSDSVAENGVYILVKKVGKNSRSIRSKIAIDASLDTVWNILTDYEKLADFIPGLAVSKLIDKKDKFARLYQVYFVPLSFFFCRILGRLLCGSCYPVYEWIPTFVRDLNELIRDGFNYGLFTLLELDLGFAFF